MAVTESRPAHHDGEPPSADGPGRPRRHPAGISKRVTR
jgi:hypothetical protein